MGSIRPGSSEAALRLVRASTQSRSLRIQVISVSRSIALIASRSIIGSARLSCDSSKSGPQRSAS